jgi:ATP/maltotriose-dependent transcriptional regulator MalT
LRAGVETDAGAGTAGYGKTTVIRRWIALMREKAIPSVYVSLDTSGDEGESLCAMRWRA